MLRSNDEFGVSCYFDAIVALQDSDDASHEQNMTQRSWMR